MAGVDAAIVYFRPQSLKPTTMIQFHPPVEERSDEQLLEIVMNEEAWESLLVEQARLELVNRRISLNQQKKSKDFYQRYHAKVAQVKANASWSVWRRVLIIFLGPIDLLSFDIFSSESVYAGEGYTKRNRQGLVCLGLGFALWAGLLLVLAW